MRCKNCNGQAGRRGTMHVRQGKFTCIRYGPGLKQLPNLPVGDLPNWSYTHERR